MEGSGPNWFSLVLALAAPLQILVVDLLLSADNALMIAMACRGLPPEDVRIAAMLGTAAAVGLRLVLAAGAVTLLQIPFLKLIAAVALVGVAIRLAASRGVPSSVGSADGLEVRPTYLSRSVATIVAADAVMSLDNIVAVATLANGNLALLAFGLALSIPLLFWGSLLIKRFLDDNPVLVLGGGMFLGWLAGGIGVADPVVQPWIEANAPALVFVAPLACAVFVLWQSLIMGSSRTLREDRDAR